MLLLSKEFQKNAEDCEIRRRSRIKTKRPALILDNSPEEYLNAIKETIVPVLTKSLYSTEKSEREAALSILKQIGTAEALSAIERAQDPQHADLVQFTAYHPREAIAGRSYNICVYAHLQVKLAEIERDIQKSESLLGHAVPKPRTAKKCAQIQIGTPLTIVPECPEIKFDPISLTKAWNGEWIRFDFRFEPQDYLLDEPLLVRVSVQIQGIEIAHIKCPVEIVAELSQSLNPGKMTNPLLVAKLGDRKTSQIYQSIFVSYSRKDKSVIQAYHVAQTAIGNDIFMDTYSIRAGEDWRLALARAIDKADIFQLFWSRNSACQRRCENVPNLAK